MAKQVIHRVRSKWSEICLCAAIGLGPLGLAASSSAQTAQARSVIEPSQVIAAMHDGSLPTEGVHVKFAAPVSSSTPMAQLAVESVSLLGSHEVRMRLSCKDRSACLPFLATATYAEAVDASAFHLGKPSQPYAVQSVRGDSALPPTPQAATAANSAMLLRAGAPAMLEFDADRIHVRIEVISLQNGTPGNRVRVSSRDHKQIYVAEVVSPTLLKGELTQ